MGGILDEGDTRQELGCYRVDALKFVGKSFLLLVDPAIRHRS